ncbi:claudin-5b [Menidia menidia]
MLGACLEALGLALGVAGWLLVMVACGLPQWRVTAFIDSNIVVAQTLWDGLWMSCVVQSTGHMQCKLHDSVLALARHLQAARALTVASAVLGAAGLAAAACGARCTTCVRRPEAKARAVRAGGALLALGGLMALVPLCWMASDIIREFHDPRVPPSKKREMGAAIYTGWAAAALLLAGGGLLGGGGAAGGLRPPPPSGSRGGPPQTGSRGGAPIWPNHRTRAWRPAGASTSSTTCEEKRLRPTVGGGGGRTYFGWAPGGGSYPNKPPPPDKSLEAAGGFDKQHYV